VEYNNVHKTLSNHGFKKHSDSRGCAYCLLYM